MIDPRSRDYAIRTMHGEAAGDPSLEAVAHVIRNRVASGRYGGNTVERVVLAKNQFEPWGNSSARARMMSLSPDSDQYKQYGDIVDRVFSGNSPDPTNGATHFYAPIAQAQLGRSAPKWDDGSGQQIGAHRFFAPEGRVYHTGDVEGPPSPIKEAIRSSQKEKNAMITPQTTPVFSAARPGNNQVPQDEGSLSYRFINNGPGALFSSDPNGPFQQAKTDLFTAMQQAGLFLRDDPAALGALSSINKTKEGNYSFVQGKDGRLYRVNKKTGQVEAAEGAGLSEADKAYDTAKSKEWADTDTKIMTGADKARETIASVQKATEYIKNPNVYQGRGGELVLEAKKLANIIPGFKFEGISDAEALRAMTNQMALKLRNPSSGEGMPGALSDNDLKFLRSSTAGLENTPEGNMKIMAYMQKIAERQIHIDTMRQDYIQRHGRLGEGFRREVADYVSKNHLFANESSGGERNKSLTDIFGR